MNASTTGRETKKGSSHENQNQGMNVTPPKKAAIYARVSTADQHSGLESQIRALKEYAEQNHIEHYELYTDENISGAKVSRPSLELGADPSPPMIVKAKAKVLRIVLIIALSSENRSKTVFYTTTRYQERCH